MGYYIYILYSEKIDKYYIGSSVDPNKRLEYHNFGREGWTKIGTPWKMVFKKRFIDKKTAMEKEQFIKKQKSKKFIKKLIDGEYDI